MEPRKAFRFGVVCWQARSRHDWREKARQAEQLGYATFLVPDHLPEPNAPGLVRVTVLACLPQPLPDTAGLVLVSPPGDLEKAQVPGGPDGGRTTSAAAQRRPMAPVGPAGRRSPSCR